ncbi:response regulator [Neisseriaceae bacterium B1]
MPYTILIVDDSNVIRNRIGRHSALMDFEVVDTASNGLDALEKYRRYKPDLVTMDLTMPKMDGLESIKAISDFDPNANILVISALSDKATGIKALEYGARGFICKPFSDEELSEAFEEMISGE